MNDEFLNLIAGLQDGQAPQVDSPQQVTMGVQAEERDQMPGVTRSFFGYEHVCKNGRTTSKKGEE